MITTKHLGTSEPDRILLKLKHVTRIIRFESVAGGDEVISTKGALPIRVEVTELLQKCFEVTTNTDGSVLEHMVKGDRHEEEMGSFRIVSKKAGRRERL